MSRLPDIDTDHLTDEQAELYEALLSRPEVAKLGLIGPFGVWMHAPDLGKAMSALGGKVRFSTSLPNNVTEVAICTTGAFHRAKFEFAAHRGLAIRAGVDEGALDRLATGEEPGFDGDEGAAYAVASETPPRPHDQRRHLRRRRRSVRARRAWSSCRRPSGTTASCR